jgi:outer membrane protein, multidrug efflux system
VKQLVCRIVTLSGALAVLSACASLHPPPRIAATLADHAPVVTQDLAAGGTWPGGQWWTAYDDPVLTRLVELAVGNGSDIAGADARLRQAQDEVRVAAAASGMQVGASAGFSRQRLSDNGMFPPEFLGYHWYDQADLGISLRYQFDWWGKQRAALEGAINRSRAVAAERQAAALILAAKVAEAYFGWLGDSNRMALQEQVITLQEKVLANVQRRIAAQLESADRATEATLQLAVQREQLEVLKGSRRLRIVTLAALTGVNAAALPQLSVRPLPRAATRLPDDVGTNLLARRPDIVASRWRVEAALRDTDVQRANYYPDVSLNALAALSAIDPGRLLRADSATPRLGVAADLPLFDAGLRRARHEASQAALEAAIADYDATVINAARDAGAAAVALQQADLQRRQREQQLESATALTAAARARVAGQLTHVGPQLEAGLRELAAQDALLRIDLDALAADIQLKQALGGDLAAMEPSS